VDDAFSDMARQPMLPRAAAFDCGAILPEHRRRPSRSTEEVDDSMVCVSLLLATVFQHTYWESTTGSPHTRKIVPAAIQHAINWAKELVVFRS